MGRLTNIQIQKAFMELIDKQPIGAILTWTQFGDTVRSKVPEGGWMQVRSVLQSFINAEVLLRTDDLRVEEYKVIDHL